MPSWLYGAMQGWLALKRRHLLVWSFVGVILAGPALLSAQDAAGYQWLSMNCGRVLGVLASRSIHLQLPFAALAITAGRAVVWTLSPTGTTSAETAVAFQEGALLVSLTLPWPQNAKGSPWATWAGTGLPTASRTQRSAAPFLWECPCALAVQVGIGLRFALSSRRCIQIRPT